MSVRIMGKGKKCRYSLLSPKLLEELRHYFRAVSYTHLDVYKRQTGIHQFDDTAARRKSLRQTVFRNNGKFALQHDTGIDYGLSLIHI